VVYSGSRGLAMRRTILLFLFALLAVSAANDACAQRGGARSGFGRSGYGFNRARAVSPNRFGYAYLPYDDSGAAYVAAPQPALFVQQPLFIQPPPPPVVKPPGHPVITEYKWPAEAADPHRSASSTAPESEPPPFAIVLKDGSTLAALTIYASDDGLHYVDPDERHLRISMSKIDRAATLKINRARNLNPYLPAAE